MAYGSAETEGFNTVPAEEPHLTKLLEGGIYCILHDCTRLKRALTPSNWICPDCTRLIVPIKKIGQ